MSHPSTTRRDLEEVAVGDLLPPLTKGPMQSPQLMRWSAAIENWHKIHYDSRFAIGHDKLPDILVNGSLKQQFILQLLKDWAGSAGWAWKARYQFRAMNLVGETLFVWGKVTAIRDLGPYGLVDVEVGITNGDGKESTPGSGVIVLPHRGGPPVPYPFVPPAS